MKLIYFQIETKYKSSVIKFIRQLQGSSHQIQLILIEYM